MSVFSVTFRVCRLVQPRIVNFNLAARFMTVSYLKHIPVFGSPIIIYQAESVARISFRYNSERVGSPYTYLRPRWLRSKGKHAAIHCLSCHNMHSAHAPSSHLRVGGVHTAMIPRTKSSSGDNREPTLLSFFRDVRSVKQPKTRQRHVMNLTLLNVCSSASDVQKSRINHFVFSPVFSPLFSRCDEGYKYR